MRTKFSDEFSEAKEPKQLTGLAVGDRVYIRSARIKESFWVTLTRVRGDQLEGKVEAQLLNREQFGEARYSKGDVVKFERKHVLMVTDEPPEVDEGEGEWLCPCCAAEKFGYVA